MLDPLALIAARHAGEIRYAVVNEDTGNLGRLLAKFGLRQDESALVEHEWPVALDILTLLLWKDLAYGRECMPRETALTWARQLLAAHAQPGARFYSNGNVVRGDRWHPLTDATFDAGLVIVNPSAAVHCCVWFEDED